MASYNGHRNWNHWNVSLWLNNDESLYRDLVQCAKLTPRDKAARVLLSRLPESTPDGARYSISAIKAAMRGLVN